MANEEHLELLKSGVENWNKWREEHSNVIPDLSGADFREANLRWANLQEANLQGARLNEAILEVANLKGARLNKANLQGTRLNSANLRGANLQGACLNKANLLWANLSEADLTGANLQESYLQETTLRGAYLQRANLQKVSLLGANLFRAELSKTNLSGAIFHETLFGDTNLKGAVGLEACDHRGPSTIDFRTIEQSGLLSPLFMQGCGLSDWEIESTKLYQPDLSPTDIAEIVTRIHTLRSESPIQVHRLFISHSHTDYRFVELLEGYLKKHHILCWRDVHDAPAGPLEKIVVLAIKNNPTMLLILSERSVKSDWVEFEAEQARNLEKELGRHVLCPIALDDSWKTCEWSGVLRNQIKKYNVLDFSRWQNADFFENRFERLLSGIDLFYKNDQG